MNPGDKETDEMLILARAKAEKLIAGIEKLIADLEANPSGLAPEKLAEGRAAMQKALESAKRMLQSLDYAEQISAVSKN